MLVKKIEKAFARVKLFAFCLAKAYKHKRTKLFDHFKRYKHEADDLQYLFREACKARDHEMIKSILTNKDFWPFSGLAISCSKGFKEIVELIINYTRNTDFNEKVLYEAGLERAYESGQIEIVKLLEEKQLAVTSGRMLLEAYHSGDFQTISHFNKKFPEAKNFFKALMALCASKNHEHSLELIREMKLDYEAKNMEKVFLAACESGNFKLIQFLFPLIKFQSYHFRRAFRTGNFKIVQFLLKRAEFDVWEKFDWNSDFVHNLDCAKLAAQNIKSYNRLLVSHIETAKIMYERFEAERSDQLLTACFNGYREVVLFLLSKKVFSVEAVVEAATNPTTIILKNLFDYAQSNSIFISSEIVNKAFASACYPATQKFLFERCKIPLNDKMIDCLNKKACIIFILKHYENSLPFIVSSFKKKKQDKTFKRDS